MFTVIFKVQLISIQPLWGNKSVYPWF